MRKEEKQSNKKIKEAIFLPVPQAQLQSPIWHGWPMECLDLRGDFASLWIIHWHCSLSVWQYILLCLQSCLQWLLPLSLIHMSPFFPLSPALFPQLGSAPLNCYTSLKMSELGHWGLPFQAAVLVFAGLLTLVSDRTGISWDWHRPPPHGSHLKSPWSPIFGQKIKYFRAKNIWP